MNQETVINQTQQQEFASFTESRRRQTAFTPEWHSKIKDVKGNVTESEVIIARDINSDGAKNFAVFDSHESVLQYSNSLPTISEYCMNGFYLIVHQDSLWILTILIMM